MKIIQNIETAKKELKDLQEFFNRNRECTTCGGAKYLNERPLKIEEIEKIVKQLKDMAELYKSTNQNYEYVNTLSSLSKYQELQFLALKNNWAEINSLDFNKQTFEVNAKYMLELLSVKANYEEVIDDLKDMDNRLKTNTEFIFGLCPFDCEGMLRLEKASNSKIYIYCDECLNRFDTMEDVKIKKVTRDSSTNMRYTKILLDEAIKLGYKDYICVFDKKTNCWRKLDGSKAGFYD